MTDNWEYPDHYIILECPDCSNRLATARRKLDTKIGCWCYECGAIMANKDVVEYGPKWEMEA